MARSDAGRDAAADGETRAAPRAAALSARRPKPDAETLLRRMLERTPTSRRLESARRSASSRPTLAAASDAWWHALDLDPDNAEASFHLGNHNLEHGEYGAAVIHYERALRGAPDHVGVLNNLGLCYKALGAPDRAEECYRAALAAEPE